MRSDRFKVRTIGKTFTHEALDVYFHRYAGQNQFRHHLGVTYVAVEEERILGFVTVSPGSLDAEELPSGRRPPPYPVPILRVARLAFDESARGKGLGRALLRFSIELAEQMMEECGCVGLLVDAKSDAVSFLPGLRFRSFGGRRGHRIAKTRADSHVPSARLRTASLVVGHENDQVHGSVPVETSRNGAATQWELVSRAGIEPSTY